MYCRTVVWNKNGRSLVDSSFWVVEVFFIISQIFLNNVDGSVSGWIRNFNLDPELGKFKLDPDPEWIIPDPQDWLNPLQSCRSQYGIPPGFSSTRRMRLRIQDKKGKNSKIKTVIKVNLRCKSVTKDFEHFVIHLRQIYYLFFKNNFQLFWGRIK